MRRISFPSQFASWLLLSPLTHIPRHRLTNFDLQTIKYSLRTFQIKIYEIIAVWPCCNTSATNGKESVEFAKFHYPLIGKAEEAKKYFPFQAGDISTKTY